MEEISPPLSLKWRMLAPLIAVTGGLFGILAAGYEESGYGWYIGPFVAAPIVEEAVKPCGVYWLLGRRPHILISQRYTAFLAALAGLSFGIIESLIYVFVYFPEHSANLVIWRFTACLLLHTGCSYIVGFGINRGLVDWVRGEVRFMGGNWRFFLAAMIIHSAYNVFAYFADEQWEWFADNIRPAVPGLLF